MPRESNVARAQRVKQLIDRFQEIYPKAHCELAHSNPLELLISTILSAQCTDKRVNLVTGPLFKRWRTAADFAQAPPAELEEAIKSTGFFRNKARNIQACCQALVQKYGGQVPSTMEELTALNGVGRKTANVVLGDAFGINCGVVVDTHVARLAYRLGLSARKDPAKIEQDLMRLLPRDQWAMFSHWLIWHGRRRCYARKPDCPHCEVGPLCPRAGVKRVGPPKAS
jgi:endonuclease-3